jgi:hypothetical protein
VNSEEGWFCKICWFLINLHASLPFYDAKAIRISQKDGIKITENFAVKFSTCL